MSKVHLPVIFLPDVRVRGRRMPDIVVPNIDLRRLAAIDLSGVARWRAPGLGVAATLRNRSLPEFAAPSLHAPVRLSELRVPQFERPQLDLPLFERPRFDVPQFDLPQFDFTHLDLLDLRRPALPSFDMPRIEIRVIRQDRSGLSPMTVVAVIGAAAAVGAWLLLKSPATGPRLRAAAIRTRRRMERRLGWAGRGPDPAAVDEAGTEPIWAQAEAEPASTAGPIAATEAVAALEPVGAGNGWTRHGANRTGSGRGEDVRTE